MAKKSSASSRRDVQLELNEESMKRIERKHSKALAALGRRPDDEIDLSDIPEVTNWSDGLVGRFYRPLKEPVTLRLDADVLAWLKSQGKGYQTRINVLLRSAMLRHRRRA